MITRGSRDVRTAPTTGPITARGIGLVLLGLAVIAAAATGCGGSDENGKSEKELIAETVNEFWSAVEANDGDAACGHLTRRGKKLMIRIARRVYQGGQAAKTCVEAVSVQAEASAHDENGPGDFTASDVLIRPDDNGAEVRCEPRGALMLERIDGDWRVSAPVCVD